MYFLSVNRLQQGAAANEVGRAVGAHVRWCQKLIAQGTLLQAGKWGPAGGMAIIKAGGLEDAERIQREDPLVLSGLATYEIAQLFPDVALE